VKAVILAAGKGTRMGNLTDKTPKPMMLIHGKPILETIITGLRDNANIRKFFIVIGYQGNVVQDYFKTGAEWNVEISYGTQEIQDGTGKAPELAKEWIGNDSFLLTYGDILVDPQDYARLIQEFKPDGVIAVKDGEDLTKGGAVLVDANGYMEDLIEKGSFTTPPSNAFYNAAIYVFTPRLFHYTAQLKKSPRGEFELTDALRQLTREGGRLKVVHIHSHWVDVRDPEVLATLNRAKR